MITYRGVVYPAQTDAMGHMNVQHYIAAFDQAFWHFVDQLGYDIEWRETLKQGWADVHYDIDFRSELQVGALFHIVSSVKKLGRTSIITHHALFDSHKQLCADINMTSVYFDLEARTSIEIPELIRVSVGNQLQA